MGGPPACATQLRQKSLGDGQCAEYIDVELPPYLVYRQHFKRAANGDTGIVDEPVQTCVAELRLQCGDGGGDRLGVGDIEV